MEDKKNKILIERLTLSVRTLNCLKNSNISSFGQLSAMSEIELMKIPNLGIKSLNEIKDLLKAPDLTLKSNPYLPIKYDNISEALDWAFEENYKFKKRKEILIDRIFNGHTLETCGKKLEVSRERIRQIESSFFKTIRKKLSEDYITELEEYFDSNSGINGFLELDNIGPAYRNISKYLIHASNPSSFFKFLFKNQGMLKWQKKTNNQYHFYPYNADSLDDLINDEKLFNFIKTSQSARLEDSVKIFCLINNQENNFDYVFKEIQRKLSKRLNFACRYAAIQLKKSYTYITADLVIEFLKDDCSKDFLSQKRQIDNVLSSQEANSIYDIRDLSLYPGNGGGNYFFLDKIGIKDNDKEEIVNFVLRTLKQDQDKHFKSIEFLDHFQLTKTLSKSTLDVLDKFIIDAILQEVEDEHDLLNYLGRGSWSGNANKLKQKRIEIYPTAVKILEDYGYPMTLSEIKEKFIKIRGTGVNFQLHTTETSPRTILVSQGMWGLRDRDINLSHINELEIVNLIKEEFTKGNKIVDFHNLKLFKELIKIDDDVSVYQLMRLLSAHIPSGRRNTPDKLIFLFKMHRSKPLNFCFYSPDITDQEALEYIELRANDEFLDVRNNEDSISPKKNYPNLKLTKQYIVKGKSYLGRDAVANEYGISTATVSNRVNSDQYPEWNLISK